MAWLEKQAYAMVIWLNFADSLSQGKYVFFQSAQSVTIKDLHDFRKLVHHVLVNIFNNFKTDLFAGLMICLINLLLIHT